MLTLISDKPLALMLKKDTANMKQYKIRKDLFQFLRRPDLDKFKDQNFKDRLRIIFKVFVLTQIGLIFANLPNVILAKINLIEKIEMKSTLFYNHLSNTDNDYRLYYFLFLLILTPLLEEFSFRLFLVKFNKKYFRISVSLITGLLIYFSFSKLLWQPNSYLFSALSYYAYILFFSIVTYSLTYFIQDNLSGLENLWNKKFNLIFYVTAFLFAIMHFNNLAFNKNDFWFLPFSFLPFFVYGLSFGYIRIKLGIIYSIILHVIFIGFQLGMIEISNALKANIL